MLQARTAQPVVESGHPGLAQSATPARPPLEYSVPHVNSRGQGRVDPATSDLRERCGGYRYAATARP